MPQNLIFWTEFTDNDNQKVTASPAAKQECGKVWCGTWNTKQEAIDSLFNFYRKKTGKILKWYIDGEGFFRWFEVGTRTGKEYIFQDDDRILEFKVTKDATNILNYFIGKYGEGDTAGNVTVYNQSSIDIYGKCVDNTVNESCMNSTQLGTYLNTLLDLKSVPLYTATVELAGYWDIPPGKQIVFPNDAFYSTIIFTVVDWKVTGTGGNNKTSLGLNTDVFSIPNEIDTVKGVAMREVAINKAKVGTVTDDLGNGRVLVELENGQGVINARYVEYLDV